MLQEHLQAWSGEAFRHIPAGVPFDVLDFRFAGRGSTNRWNESGEPTLYLAGDIGVAITEFGRHFAIDRSSDLGKKTIERTVYRLGLTLDAVFDLRLAAVWSELSLRDAPLCFLDIPIARATARFIRTTTPAQGMIVPSVAFLDSQERWCLVVFLEKLPADQHAFISSIQVEGPLRWQ